MKKTLFILLLLTAFVQNANAQAYKRGTSNDSIFISCPVVIFQDNFLTDSPGAFPKHWWIIHHDSAKYKHLNVVRELNGKRALVTTNVIEKQTDIMPLLCRIAPRMSTVDYLPPDFSLEYDFLLGYQVGLYPTLSFYATNANMILDIYFSHGEIMYVVTDGRDIPDETVQIPGFNYKLWHHFAMSYHSRQATFYIDGKEVLATPQLIRDVYKFQLGNWGWGKSIIAYTNFRLATDSTTANDLNRLLTENTFTTHAILFDVNKATIKPESAAFIKQLSEWLQANPIVNLEIDGHTDNDGEAAANIKLSQARADEVKKQLVSLGIAATRLTTKGFGDTKPIKPNTTPKGKAENRRVEFIRK